MLTISQLAAYAGVSVRAVRHYHQIGLLPEPPRDSSGYRRYAAEDVIRLVRIKALAAGGVPLARVAELLEAERDEFAAAIAEVDAALAAQIAELEEHRQRLRRMTDPDAGVLGPNARRVLAGMETWLGSRCLEIERESAVLMAVLYPESSEEWMAWQEEAFESEEARELYRRTEAAYDWDPEDPRLEELARETVRITNELYPVDHPGVHDWWDELDVTAYRLIDQHGVAWSPAWRRLTARVKELMSEAGYDVPDWGT